MPPSAPVNDKEGRPVIERKSKWIPRLLIGATVAFLVLFLVVPLVFVLVQAFSKGLGVYFQSITDTYAVQALALTLATVLSAVAVNTIFGLFAAWSLTRYRFFGRKIINTFIDLPLSVSPVIAGLIFLLTFGRSSPIYPLLTEAGVRVVYAIPGIILATIFVTFPYVSREIIPVLEARGTEEEEAAALMGARGFTIFRKITFPHIKWAFLYGVVLCSARALGEFGAVSVLSGRLRGRTLTLPLYIESLYQEYSYAPAFAVSSILVVLAIIVLVAKVIIESMGNKRGDL